MLLQWIAYFCWFSEVNHFRIIRQNEMVTNDSKAQRNKSLKDPTVLFSLVVNLLI